MTQPLNSEIKLAAVGGEYERDQPDRRAALMMDGDFNGVFVSPEMAAATRRFLDHLPTTGLAHAERKGGAK
jgi:hypothetical protein